MKKAPPPNTLNALRPPHEHYFAFENWQSHPFKHSSESFEMVNAWWLAEAALLAYGNEKFVNDKFAAAGLTDAGFAVRSFSEANIQFFVAHNEKFIIAAFRGTEIDNPKGLVKDVMTDGKVLPVPDGAGGLVHHGFNDAISTIWNSLHDRLIAIQSDGKTRTLWLTGHSLGAAIATLAADRITRVMNIKVNGLYTYGSPRVGNIAFIDRLSKDGLAARTYRIVNNKDAIAKVSPEGVYRHVGSWKLINDHGQIQDVVEGSQLAREAASFKFWESLRNTVKSLLNSAGITNDAPDYLADHAPIYYAIHIWNYYEEHLAP